MQSLWRFLLDLCYPDYCYGCQKTGQYLCATCYELLHFISFPLHLDVVGNSLDSTQVAVEYGFPISAVLHALKYQSVKGIAQWCAELLYLSVNLPSVDVITSVPLHPHRFNERGFNQAAEIGQQLAKLMKLPYVELLIRNKYTSPQALSKSETERKTRLSGIFEMRTDPQPSVHSKNILLIDDVLTTGATLNECANVLKKGGAAAVHGLAVAHGN